MMVVAVVVFILEGFGPVLLHDHESKILCPSYAESSIVLTCPIAFFSLCFQTL